MVDQFYRYRNFFYRIFGKRNSYSIANSIAKQSANPNDRFNSSIFAFAFFGNTQMNRVFHIFQTHC